MARDFFDRIGSELSFANLVGPVEMSKEQALRLRAAQQCTIRRLISIIVLGNLLNVSVMVVSFWGTELSRLVSLWGGTMGAVLAYITLVNFLHKPKQDGEITDIDLSALTRGATILGVLWGLVPMLVFPFGDSVGFTAVGMLLMGTMFGGVLLIGRVPEAAMGFVLPIVIGILIGLQFQQDPRSNLLSILTLASAGLLYFAARLAYTQFAQQHLDKAVLVEQTEVIGLLLRDFGATSSDWLWETDAQGVFVPLPVRMGETVQQNDRIVEGRRFVDLVRDEALAAALANQQPFRDVIIKMSSEPDMWWSVTGKPIFDKSEFSGFRGVAADVTQAKKSEDRIAFMAHFDTLTELPNRGSLTQKLREISESPEAWGQDYVLAWLDLDDFKWVNDTLGHQAGDDVLRCVAERLRSFVDDETLLARISGDEFALIGRFRDFDELKQDLNSLSTLLATPYDVWGSSVLCRASIGVKVITGRGFDVESALKHADMALYKAKEYEKGAWTLYDQQIEESARAMRELEVDLNNAIDRDEMRIYYQPIVDAVSNEVVACETLLRWQHPTKGLLMPDAFIPFAEDNGIITRLGDWVLQQVLSEARRMPDHVRIAVNISPMQIHNSNLVPTILTGLATNGISPDRLELEITESVMMTDTQSTMQRLRSLKDLGLRIALDDFGTGFSSLSYLRQFQFDKLKIDKSFTKDIESDEDCQAIIKATLQLAKALGMATTGEGVETAGQGHFLREEGCDQLQGYMISRPQPLDRLGHLIELKDVEAELAVENTAPSTPYERLSEDVKIASRS